MCYCDHPEMHEAIKRDVEQHTKSSWQTRCERAESALQDSRVYVTEIASGVAHYSGPGGCGDPNPCVRCQRDAAKARLARLEEVEKAASAVQRELRPDDFMPNSVRVPAPTWDRLAEALARAREQA